MFGLFALPFAAAGLFTSGMIYHALYQWVEVQNWQKTPAQIVSVEIDDKRDTVKTEVKYEYQWGDDRYVGDRLCIQTETDNVSSFHERVGTELQKYKNSGEPFRCFVSPSQPSQSVLYRDLRWEILSFLSVFGTLFGSIGMGLLGGIILSIPNTRFAARARVEHPDSPWMWDADWVEGIIRGEGRHRWLKWFAAYWVVVSLPGGLGAVNAIAHGSLLSVFGLIIPGIAFFITRKAWRNHIQNQTYGETRVSLDRFPAITGGVMTGTVLIEEDVDPLASWRLRLTCTTKRRVGDDTRTDIVYEAEDEVDQAVRSLDWGRSAVPFRFVIPFAARQTQNETRSQAEWKLKITSHRTDVLLEDSFVIPVFKTDESSPHVDQSFDDRRADTVQGTRDEAMLDQLYPDDSLLEAKLVLSEQPDGTVTIVAPIGRYIRTSIGFGIFVLFWDGLSVAIWLMDAPLLFPIVFGLLGLLVTWCFFDLLLSHSRIEIGRESLTFRNGWFGTSRQQEVKLQNIRDVTSTSNMSIGNKPYPNVKIHLASGKTLTVMSLIRGRRAASRVVERILEAAMRD